MTTTFDITYECGFDGELGSVMSLDAHGHLSFDDAEVFLADTVERELRDAGFDESPAFGLEIERLWRGEHPLELEDDPDDGYGNRWTYSYTETERPGAVPVTRFQIASPWSRAATSAGGPRANRDRKTNEFIDEGVDYFPLMCIHHPDEPAVSGMPEHLFIDPSPESVIDGNVHYCAPCLSAFNTRLRVAREKVLAPERTEAFLAATDDEVILRAYGYPLRRDDLTAVLTGADTDGRGRRALTRFADAYRAAVGDRTHPIAVAQPGWKVLMLSDVEHLVADYSA